MFSFYFIFPFFTFLYINFQRVLKGMKGEHVIDDTGDAGRIQEERKMELS